MCVHAVCLDSVDYFLLTRELLYILVYKINVDDVLSFSGWIMIKLQKPTPDFTHRLLFLACLCGLALFGCALGHACCAWSLLVVILLRMFVYSRSGMNACTCARSHARAHTHARTHALAYVYTHTHTRTHTHTNTHTHTHTRFAVSTQTLQHLCTRCSSGRRPRFIE